MMSRWRTCALAFLALWAAAESGCALSAWLGGRGPGPRRTSPVTTTEVSPPVIVSVVPAYRLILSPHLADAPSRLLVLHARLEALNDETLRLSPGDVTLRLPDGSPGKVFDPPRAIELLRRTDIGAADLSYVGREAGFRPGGLPQAAKPAIKEEITTNLLYAGDFDRRQPIDGYLVVDTEAPLADLDGVVLEIVASRVDDTTALRYTYRFAHAAIAGEAP
jgi:hypothetical protein